MLKQAELPRATEFGPFTVPGRRGFVLPAILIGLVIMTVVAVAALAVASDEQRSSRAMHEATGSFYAAEAGMNAILATWDSTTAAAIEALGPGESVDLGWNSLDNGASYRAVVRRLDNGGQALYSMEVEGRNAGLFGGQRTLSYTLTPAGGDAGYMLGQCCDAAVTAKGGVTLDSNVGVSGFDEHPPGWEDAGVCADSLYDKPGISMTDTTQFELIDTLATPFYLGDPPIAQDTTITDDAFEQFGPLSWDSLAARADHVIDTGSGQLKLDEEDVFARYNADDTCDTSHPYNWGSDDPDDPCFDYFPIILIRGEVEVHEAYGQGIIVIDWDESLPDGEKGGEFELETDMRFSGIILGKGCVEIQKGAEFYGAVFVDGAYRNEDLCAEDSDFEMNQWDSITQWSQCAVDRAITNSGLAEFAEATLGGTARPLGTRAFGEPIY